MHSVSPVRVRIDGLKNPMTTTNFEEAYNNKSKKKVQIGASTFFKEAEKPNKLNTKKSTILNRINPKTKQTVRKKTNQGNEEYDQVPVKENLAITRKLSSKPLIKVIEPRRTPSACSTCIESRSRSNSKTSDLRTQQTDSAYVDLSNTSRDNTSNSSYSLDGFNDHYLAPPSPKRRVCSLSPIRSVWNDYDSHMSISDFHHNQTYTKLNNRTRSYDSSVRDLCCNSNSQFQPELINSPRCPMVRSPMLAKPTIIHNRESLCKKLAITEETIDEIGRQLTMLRDYLVANSPHHFLNAHTIAHLTHERDRIIENLDIFETRKLDLKETIYAISGPACMNNIKLIEENQMLSDKLNASEIEKSVNANFLIK